MEEDAGEELGLGRSRAPTDFHFYHMDLYDSEDRLQLFPGESGRIRSEVNQAELTSEPRGAGDSKSLPKEVDELVHLYGLEDDHELGDEFVDEHRLGTLEYPPYGPRRRDPAREQRDWGLSEAAEAEDLGYGLPGQCQDLREAYRYTHGRASEEYECYVIPEEEDEEEEPADVFCATCKTPVRTAEKDVEAHEGHEVMPLNKALESAKVAGLLPSLSAEGVCLREAGRERILHASTGMEWGDGEMAERLGALAPLVEDLGSITSIHTVAHNHL